MLFLFDFTCNEEKLFTNTIVQLNDQVWYVIGKKALI